MIKLSIVVFMFQLIFALGCSSPQLAKPNKANSVDQTNSPTTKTENGTDSKTKQLADGETIRCKFNGDERTISINSSTSGCTLFYTKFNEKKEIASSRHGKAHCQEVKTRITKRLTSVGFACGK